MTFVGLSFMTSLLALVPLFLLASLLFSTPLMLGLQKNIPGSVALWVTVFEYLRQDTFMATPWFWHATIALDSPLLQSAIPAGGQFMTTYFVCLSAWLIALALRDGYRKYSRIFIMIILFFACLNITPPLQSPVSSKTFPVHIIQGNVPTAHKKHAEKTWQVYSTLLATSPDEDGLHLFPEGALSYVVEDESELAQFHQPGVLKNSIIGTNLWLSQFTPSLITTGKVHGLYHKRRLVPFGENNPFSFLFPQWLKNHYPFLASLEPISAPSKLTFNQTAIYPFLCYELFFSPLDKKQLADSELLVSSAENTWYGNSVINDYFLTAARFRALESGKPLALALNRGPSAIINSSGQITHKLAYDERGILDARVTTKNGQTLYHVLPDSVILLSLIVLDILLFLGLQHGHLRNLFRSKH